MQPFIQLGRVVTGNGAEPLAQHGLDGIFPAGVDMNLLPQRGRVFKSVATQPVRQFARLPGPRLHLLERRPARLGCGQFALTALQFFLDLAAGRLELRQFLLQLLQVILIAGQFLAEQRQFLFLFGEIQCIRRVVATTLLAQPLAALGNRLQGALGMRLVGQLDFETLLAVARPGPQALQLFLGLGMAFLDLRRDVHLLAQALVGLGDAQAGGLLQFLPFLAVNRELLRRPAPVRQLVFELDQARLELIARLAAMADLGLQARHFGVGRVHVTLRLVQRIAGGKVRLTGFLGARLGFAQRGILRLEIGHGALDFDRHPLPLGLGFALFHQPQHLLALQQLLVQRLVVTRHLGLRFQPFHLAAEFEADVLDPRQVLARILEPSLRFLAPLLVAGDPGRLLEKDAQVVRPRLDDARDHPLADDRVGARAEAGAEEEIGDVLAPYLQVVDEVVRLPLPRQRALDRKFGILRPLAERPAEQVLENQLDGSARHGLAARRPVEDDVHHRLAAQFGSFRLAQHPAHGIHDVGLAAAIWPDDADQLPGDGNGCRIDEGLEAGEFESGQAHWVTAGSGMACLDGGRIIASTPFR